MIAERELIYNEKPNSFHVHGECTKQVVYKILDYIDDMKTRGWHFTKHERIDLENGNIKIDYALEVSALKSSMESENDYILDNGKTTSIYSVKQSKGLSAEEILLKYTPYLGSANISYKNIFKAMVEFADAYYQEKIRDELSDFLNWMCDHNFVNAMTYLNNEVTVDKYLNSK